MNQITQSKNRTRLIAWLIAIAVIFALSWYKDVENQIDKARQMIWIGQSQVFDTQFKKERQRLNDLFSSYSSTDYTKQKLEAEFNDGKPLESIRMGDVETVEVPNLKYGIEIAVSFEDGKMTGMRVGDHRSKFFTDSFGPLPTPTRYTSFAEFIRKLLIWPAIVLWIAAVLFVLWPSRYRKARRIASECAVILSLVAGATWLVDPHATVYRMFSNDILVAALVMYVVSVVLLAIHASRQNTNFQFKLSTLLLVTPLVAILFVLQPIGHVTLGMFLLGAAIFFPLWYFLKAFSVTTFRPQPPTSLKAPPISASSKLT